MIYNGHRGFTDLAATVNAAVMDIAPFKKRFDFIVVQGMSGALIGSPLSLRLDIPLVVVRKPTENQHSSRPLINEADAFGKFLFLDDFISLGYTFDRVMRVMEKETSAEYAGTYLYEDRNLAWEGEPYIKYTQLEHPHEQFDISVRFPSCRIYEEAESYRSSRVIFKDVA